MNDDTTGRRGFLKAAGGAAAAVAVASRPGAGGGADVARCVRITTNAGYRGYFAVEYEEQGDGVVGSKQIMEEVLAAL